MEWEVQFTGHEKIVPRVTLVGTGNRDRVGDLLGRHMCFCESLLACLNGEVDPGLAEKLVNLTDRRWVRLRCKSFLIRSDCRSGLDTR